MDISYMNKAVTGEPLQYNTIVTKGYEVYSESGKTMEFFTTSIAEAYRIAKRALKERRENMVIGKVLEECFVEPDGAPHEIYQYVSLKEVKTLEYRKD